MGDAQLACVLLERRVSLHFTSSFQPHFHKHAAIALIEFFPSFSYFKMT